MKIYLATDHAGYEIKNAMVAFLVEKGYEAIDCGPFSYDKDDDYPPLIAEAAKRLSEDAQKGIDSRGIIFGGSGQGEAMVANRFKSVRCAVYYGAPAQEQTDTTGKTLNMVQSTREHNNANCLSLGARFLTEEKIKNVALEWLSTNFSGEERHQRRISQIDTVC